MKNVVLEYCSTIILICPFALGNGILSQNWFRAESFRKTTKYLQAFNCNKVSAILSNLLISSLAGFCEISRHRRRFHFFACTLMRNLADIKTTRSECITDLASSSDSDTIYSQSRYYIFANTVNIRVKILTLYTRWKTMELTAKNLSYRFNF